LKLAILTALRVKFFFYIVQNTDNEKSNNKQIEDKLDCNTCPEGPKNEKFLP